MKTALSFGLVVAAASTLFACSDTEDPACRTNCGGTGNSTANTGGTTNTGNGGTSGGSTGGSSGQGSGPPPMYVGNVGEPLAISGVDANNTVINAALGINGVGFIAQSTTMLRAAEFSAHDGKLCMKGETAAVVGGDYTSAWGAELIIDLNRPNGPPPGAGDAGAADAGDAGSVAAGDAGGGDVIQATGKWDMGNVIGFGYRIEGQDPALPESGIPDLGMRFKGLPQGALGADDTFCSTRCPGTTCPTDGLDEVLFSDITYECWAAGGTSLADPMISRTDPATLVPNPNALQNISWNVNADPGVTKPFNFCVYDIRPIIP
jgi:hypothetical protein